MTLNNKSIFESLENDLYYLTNLSIRSRNNTNLTLDSYTFFDFYLGMSGKILLPFYENTGLRFYGGSDNRGFGGSKTHFKKVNIISKIHL